MKVVIIFYSHRDFSIKPLFVKPPYLGNWNIVTNTEETLSDLWRQKWKLIKKNSIMVCCIGSLWKVWIAWENLCTNQQINSVYFDEKLVEFKYWYYFCTTLEKIMTLMANKSVVAIINKSIFSTIKIPLPPLPTQKLIVQKLDLSFEKIDKSIEITKKNLENLEQLNKSILEEVFRKWEYEEKMLWEISEIINGWTPDTQELLYWDWDIFWITPKDMWKLKSVYVDNTIRKISKEWLKNSSAKIFPINSIVLSSRAPIWYLAINTVPMSTNQWCKAIVPSKILETKYLYYFLFNSVKLLNDLGSWTTFKELSSWKLKEVFIPLPPLPKQKEIVTYLTSVFEKNKSLKSEYERKLKDLEELKQSLLKEAFEWRLVKE